jgi:hypothetical protein
MLWSECGLSTHPSGQAALQKLITLLGLPVAGELVEE